MNNQKDPNLFFAIGAMLLIMGGWHYFYEMPRQEAIVAQHLTADRAAPAATGESTAHHAAPAAHQPTALQYAQDAAGLKAGAISGTRIAIDTPFLTGSFNTRGSVFDDLSLKNYQATVAEDSPLVSLWNAQGSKSRTLMEVSWTGPKDEAPNTTTVWQTASQKLTPTSPVSLTWQSPGGLVYLRKISVDANYLFTIEDTVINQGTAPVTLSSQARVHRIGTPEVSGYAVLHEGPIGHMDHKLFEVSYDDIQKDFPKTTVTGGWIGYSDQYWLSALMPKQDEKIIPIGEKITQNGTDVYAIGYQTEAKVLAPGQQIAMTHHCYGGAKIVSLLDQYEKLLTVEHLDKAVDFGWFYIITKPVFFCLAYLKEWIGNFGLAILLLTILVKLLFFPLANKSYRSMGRMRTLQPKIKAIQTRFKDDKVQQHQATMALYKKEKVNPMAGCLPMIVQIPVFFSLYKVLFISIEMRHAPFFGWINDLAAPDPTSVFNLFGLIPWDPPSFLMIGVWPLLMGGTMFWQQKLSPAPADPAQEKAFLIMPVVFTYLFATFPAGLVIYWTWNNFLSIGQQWWMMRATALEAAAAEILPPHANDKKR